MVYTLRGFGTCLRERRRRPREDLLTGLVQAEVEGSKLTHAEMIQMLVLLLVAGKRLGRSGPQDRARETPAASPTNG